MIYYSFDYTLVPFWFFFSFLYFTFSFWHLHVIYQWWSRTYVQVCESMEREVSESLTG